MTTPVFHQKTAVRPSAIYLFFLHLGKLNFDVIIQVKEMQYLEDGRTNFCLEYHKPVILGRC